LAYERQAGIDSKRAGICQQARGKEEEETTSSPSGLKKKKKVLHWNKEISRDKGRTAAANPLSFKEWGGARP